MDVLVLGPVEASYRGSPIDLGPRQQRLLLAVLALKVNRPVSLAQLVDLTWPDTPPPTAQHAIHVRVCGLRAALAAAGRDGPTDTEIVTRGDAYLLRADPLSVDAHRFRALVRRAQAEADDEMKVGLLREAAALWRGPALTGAAPLAVVDRLCRGLEEIRLMAVEDRLDAELRLGRHRAVLDELIDLVAEYPHRQRLVGQLMLGLYRDARGPDAVSTYLTARSRLVDNLGLDPDEALQDLYLRILRGDRVLGPPDELVHRPAAAGPPPARHSRPETGRSRPAAVRIRLGQLARRLQGGVMTKAGPAVEARRLTKRYGPRTAVDQLSFTAERGEVLGLLGSNGAGKTTTIRLLTTMLTPTGGEFSVAGVPHTSEAEIRRRVGVLPEDARYPGRQTGLEYLVYQARLFGLNRVDATRAAERLLVEVGLGGRGGSRISTYSRGMRQRLGVARALLNEPSVVLLDEPTLGLDPAGQRQVLDLVGDISAHTGATVVLSTHALPDVQEVCTRALVMEEGRVAAAGTVAEVSAQLADAARPGAGTVR